MKTFFDCFNCAILGLAWFIPAPCQAWNAPTYFVPLPDSSCEVFGGSGAARVYSGGIEPVSGPALILVGARGNVPCRLEAPENRMSAFLGNDPGKWRTHTPLAKRTRFVGVYPGVDFVYYGTDSGIEYDIELAPGANASQILIAFDGSRPKIGVDGGLLVTGATGTVIMRRPSVRQGERTIPAHYTIDHNRRVRLALGPYDHSKPLTIDPVLSWQVAVNGSGSYSETVAADRAGNMWILADFPGKSVVFGDTFGPGGDPRNLMLLKVDPTGSQLLYAVMIGGSSTEFGNGLAIGSDGSAYITGQTASNDFPVTAGAFQTQQLAWTGSSAFVVKVSPKGDSLVYSTYLSGTGGAVGEAIAVDSAGNAYITGQVRSPDFPLTAGSYEDHFSVYPLSVTYALRDIAGGFVVKLDSTGTSLIYSTLIDQTPLGIAVNSAGAAYVAGYSLPYLPPLSSYTLQTGDVSQSGTIITRLNPLGTRADFNVFLGCFPLFLSHGNIIALDSQSNIFIAGSSACSTFPAGTDGAFQPQHSSGSTFTQSNLAAGYDALIVKIAAEASSVLAATFLGGSDVDQVSGIAVASDDSVLVTGGTSSTNFPVTPDALQPAYGGGAVASAGVTGDGFFARLSPDLKQLRYSTYLGGAGADLVTAMALDLAGNVYMGGSTLSGRNSPGVFSFGSTGTLWALRLGNDYNPPPSISSVSPALLTAGGSASISISGANFLPNATVLVNGAAVPTSATSSSQLSASLNASLLAFAGTLSIEVLNPASASSNSWFVPVSPAAGMNPAPQITVLLPDSVPAGSAAQSVTLQGSGFLASSVVSVNGSPRSAKLNLDQSLTVTLTTSDLASTGLLNITVTNTMPGGGSSGPAAFTVSAPLQARMPPGLASISPSSMPAGGAPRTITLSGSAITLTSVARWNGASHPLTLSSTSEFTFTASASDLANPGPIRVTIYDAATGLESNPLPFWISAGVDAQDMAVNPANGLMYIATPTSLVVVDPATGKTAATVPLSSPFGRIEISPDGGYLFAITNQGLVRYMLPAASPWLGSSVVVTSNASDFAPVPGSPGSVAVYGGSFSPSFAIFDGAAMRPSTAKLQNAPSNAQRGLQFSSDGKTLYYAAGYGSPVLVTIPVISGGLGSPVVSGSASDASTPGTIFGGRIYTLSGNVFDLATLNLIGSIPVASTMEPLVTTGTLITVASGNQYYCSVQAFDSISLAPLWEENVAADCTSNYGVPRVLDAGGGRLAFIVSTVAYLAQRPGPAPLHSITPLSPAIKATLELGASWIPDNQFAILSAQSTVPVTTFLLPGQQSGFTLGPIYEHSQFSPAVTPAAYTFTSTNSPALGQYSGTAVVLLSNTTNPPLTIPYNVSIINPYPLQASVSSLSFTSQPGTPPPAPQTFTITKQGETVSLGFAAAFPGWFSAQNSANSAPATITVKVNPAGLAAGTYTDSLKFASSTATESLSVPVTLTVLPSTAQAPVVSAIQDAESSNTSIVPGEWVAIYGSGLASTSRTWNVGDFTSGNSLPTAIDGVMVTFAGKPAAVYYVSPSQINVQAPSGLAGSVPVVVSLNNNPGAGVNVTAVAQSPSLFVYQAGSRLYPAATHLNGTLIGDPTVQPESSAASVGETIVLYVNGLASSLSGSVISSPQQYSGAVSVKVGNANAAVTYAGLVAAGQFQLNIQIPSGLASGDYPLSITSGGVTSPGLVTLPIR